MSLCKLSKNSRSKYRTNTHILTCPWPTSLLDQLLAFALKGLDAAAAERGGGREEGREGRGLSEEVNRDLPVAESQRCAYHCLSLIHHDRDRERLNKQERRGDRGENKGENRGRGVSTD